MPGWADSGFYQLLIRSKNTFSVISFIEATVVTSKWPLLRLKSMKRQSLTPRSMACWEAFIISADGRRNRFSVAAHQPSRSLLVFGFEADVADNQKSTQVLFYAQTHPEDICSTSQETP